MEWKKANANNRILYLVTIGGFFWAIGASLFFRIMPIYVSKLGGTSFHAGIITSTLTITGLIALNLGGILSHHFSPRIIIIIGWMFSSIAALIYLSIPTISGVLLGAILEGLAFIEMPPRVHIFSCLYPKNTHKALYTFIGGLSLGFLIGPPMGGFMAQYIGYKSIFITYAILAALATIIIGSAIPYISPLKSNYTKRANYIHVTKKIIWPIAVTSIIAIGSGSVNVVISLYLKDTLHIKEAFIGSLSALSPLASMTLPLIAHMGLNPVHILKLMGIGLTIASSMILTPSIFSAILFYFTSGWAGGLYGGAQSITLPFLEDFEKSIGTGIISSTVNLGIAIGSLIGGYLYKINPHLPFLTTALLSIIVVFIPHNLLVPSHHDKQQAA